MINIDANKASEFKLVGYNNKIIVIGLFILNPGLSLPLVFWQIYRGHKYAFILLALFLSMWAYLLAPIGDMYRYSMDLLFILGFKLRSIQRYPIFKE